MSQFATSTRIASLTARVFGRFVVEHWRYEQIGAEDFELVIDERGRPQGHVDLALTIRFEQDWTVESVDAAEVLRVDFD